MVLVFLESEAFVPDSKRDERDYGQKKEKELMDPPLDVLPSVLRVVILKVDQRCDEGEPDDVVLADKHAEEAEKTGDPRAVFKCEE